MPATGYRAPLDQTPIVVDQAAITLSTTMLALWPVAVTIRPAQFWHVGRMIKMTAFGKATTDGTAGNYVFEIGYGTGNAPAALVAGRTVAGTVSQTNVTWMAIGHIECRAIGASGVLRMWGWWAPDVALLASTLQPYNMPSATPADITVDLTTATMAPTFQCQRSGAGVWTMTTTNLVMEDIGS